MLMNESLFAACILPTRPANNLTLSECEDLVREIKRILQRAIDTGGSTLKDFVNSDGKSGYFQQEYRVYGKQNEPCSICQTPISKIVLGQRASFFCPNCQH